MQRARRSLAALGAVLCCSKSCVGCSLGAVLSARRVERHCSEQQSALSEAASRSRMVHRRRTEPKPKVGISRGRRSKPKTAASSCRTTGRRRRAYGVSCPGGCRRRRLRRPRRRRTGRTGLAMASTRTWHQPEGHDQHGNLDGDGAPASPPSRTTSSAMAQLPSSTRPRLSATTCVRADRCSCRRQLRATRARRTIRLCRRPDGQKSTPPINRDRRPKARTTTRFTPSPDAPEASVETAS